MFSSANTLPHQVLAQLSQLTSSVITSTSVNPGVRSKSSKAAQKIRFQQHQTSAAAVTATARQSTISSVAPPVLNSQQIDASNPIPNAKQIHNQNQSPIGLTDSLDPAAVVSILDVNTFNSSRSSNGLSMELASKILISTSSSSTSNLSDLSNLLLPSGFLNLNAVSRIWDKIIRSSKNFENSWDSSSVKALLRNYKLVDYVRTLESSSRYYYQNPNSFKTLGSFELDKRYAPPSPFNYSVFNQVPSRSFKTSRDKAAEEVRNPSLFSRIKNKLFPPYPPLPQAKTDSIGTIPQPGAGASPQQQDRLKALMTELPPDEASRVKIAFAEGYIAANPTTSSSGSTRTYRWLRTLQQILAIAVFTAILASLMGSFGGGLFRVNVGNGNEVQPEDINVTFQDVKGVDEAKAELQEIVEFLRSPEKFVQLGGKLPKGVLLVGPPGTGKTLLARAVAGEAGVPFFHAAGPEFDEILVGQGARRVRDLFKAAKVKAPCVIFIDEIDSVGAKRTNSVLHPYANQTINQLLTEMDGFRQNEGVIVLGATNRREDLDRALLRPGRFDVEVNVPAPELKGRKEILEYYLGRVKRGDDVDVDILARGTTGFTGADLENMVNQAALRAAIEGADRVLRKHLDFARDKVIMGPERKTRIPDEETNRITAYHEAGHAIVAHYTKDSNPLHKVTIIPRGQSLGHTAYIPDKERYHVTRSQLMALMDTMMGGRAAEELIFGPEKITSGASSDLKQATSIASQMVKQWGMSEKVGLRTVEDDNKSLVTVNELGNNTSELIDREINRLLNESYERAKAIIIKYSKQHDALADALIKYETLDADDVKAIFAGQGNTIGLRKDNKSPGASPPPTTPKSSPPSNGQPGGTGTGGPIGPIGLGKPNPCP